jgi:hypothetical protein
MAIPKEFLELLWQKDKEAFLAAFPEMHLDFLRQDLLRNGSVECEGYDPIDLLPGDVLRVRDYFYSPSLDIFFEVKAERFRITTTRRPEL